MEFFVAVTYNFGLERKTAKANVFIVYQYAVNDWPQGKKRVL